MVSRIGKLSGVEILDKSSPSVKMYSDLFIRKTVEVPFKSTKFYDAADKFLKAIEQKPVLFKQLIQSCTYPEDELVQMVDYLLQQGILKRENGMLF